MMDASPRVRHVGRLAYEVLGSGEPVMCLTNVASPADALRGLAPLLEEQRLALVTVDTRATTATSPQAIAEELDDVLAGIGEPAWLLGYSQGACIAQELALRSPARTRGAILVATRGRLTRFLRAYLETLRTLSSQHERDINDMLHVMATYDPDLLAEDPVVEYAFDRTRRSSASANDDLEARSVAMSLAYDGRLHDLRSIVVPCLVLAFEHDIVCPPRLGREVAAAVPSARMVVVPAAGHGGLHTHPVEVIEAVARFVREVAPERTMRGSR